MQPLRVPKTQGTLTRFATMTCARQVSVEGKRITVASVGTP